VSNRPYTLLSCAVSVDGYLDDASDQRLLVSNEADFDRVDEVRAGCDAILVGANTIRRDNPRLVIRDPSRRAARIARGLPPDPVKVTITRSGDLDPTGRFFTVGDATRLVYSPVPLPHLDGVATVVVADGADRGQADPKPADTKGADVNGTDAKRADADGLAGILADLYGRGVRRLMVEGGASVLTSLLDAGLADELHLAIGEVFVGDAPGAPRVRGRPGGERPRLVEVHNLDGVAVLRYLLSPAAVDRHWLGVAIEEAWRCQPSRTAYSVGAVVVDAAGREIARGFSREGFPLAHAEEAALSKVDITDPRLSGATIYSSLEPCSVRKSGRPGCAALILAAGIPRVVYGWREPALFVDGHGVEELRDAGVEVIEVPALESAARAPNAHLTLPPPLR
jgi:5-amino-6-(5-phosphoribosylamino)uracil reductase